MATTTKKNGSNGKLTPEQFVLKAIEKLRGDYKGIHTRFSGFNDAFRQQFPDLDPIKVVDGMHEKGIIVRQFRKGGAMIYLPTEAPVFDRKANAEKVLASILN